MPAERGAWPQAHQEASYMCLHAQFVACHIPLPCCLMAASSSRQHWTPQLHLSCRGRGRDRTLVHGADDGKEGHVLEPSQPADKRTKMPDVCQDRPASVCVPATLGWRLVLRGGAGDNADIFGDGVDEYAGSEETPFGESGARELQKVSEVGVNIDDDGYDDIDEAAFNKMLHTSWDTAQGDTAQGAVHESRPAHACTTACDAEKGEDRGAGFWEEGEAAWRCSALYCQAEELMRAPHQHDTRTAGEKNTHGRLLWLQMQAAEVIKRVSVPPAKERRQKALLDKLSAAVHDIWGDAAVLTPYGSAAAGYGTVESDVDLQVLESFNIAVRRALRGVSTAL